MSQVCEVTGKTSLKGCAVSHAMNHSIKHQKPNLHRKRFFIPEENRWVSLRVSAHGARTISKKGISTVLREMGK